MPPAGRAPPGLPKRRRDARGRGGGGLNPYVFIVGCARSGNTLVQRLADAHPQLAVMHGTRWIARWYDERIGVDSRGRVTAELADRLPEHERFGALELAPEELRALVEGRPRYAELVRELFDRFGRRRRKPLVGDKTPEYVQRLPTLHELFPRARFIHVVRDGRDVFLSVAEWGKGATRWRTWTEDPVGTGAAWWDLNVRLAREAGAELGPALYHELRYESLVADPAGECARLCAFLELEFDEGMLRFHEGRERDEPGLDAKRAWRPVTPGLRSWRDELPRADAARFEAVAGELLEELGYERSVARTSGADARRGRALRAAYARGSRSARVPATWAVDA